MGAEHNESESLDSTYESNRIFMGTGWALTPRTYLNGRVSQTWTETGGVFERDVSLFRASGSLRTRMTRHLNLSGKAEFRKEESSDSGPTDGYKIGAALQYNRSAFSARAGLDYYYLNHLNVEREGTVFYLTVTRRF